MNKSLKSAACLALVLALSGCVERWQKPGASEADFEITKASCANRSALRFPPMMRLVQLADAHTTPVVTDCKSTNNSTHCVTRGGDFVPPTIVSVDDNEDARNKDSRLCLFEHGWQPVHD